MTNNNYLFRGKRIDNGEWAEGNLINKISPHEVENVFWCSLIHDGALTAVEVDPETVGQWTGIEIDQKKIFGGDILKGVDKHYEVFYKDGCWWAISADITHWVFHLYDCMDMVLIGNKFDNPDLLK